MRAAVAPHTLRTHNLQQTPPWKWETTPLGPPQIPALAADHWYPLTVNIGQPSIHTKPASELGTVRYDLGPASNFGRKLHARYAPQRTHTVETQWRQTHTWEL